MIEDPSIRHILQSADGSKYEDIISTLNELNKQNISWNNISSIHILRNYTLESIEHYIKFYGYKNSLAIDVTFSNYDSYLYEILDKTSTLHKKKYKLVFLTLFLENLPFAFNEKGYLNTETVCNHMIEVVNKLKESVGSTIAVSTFLPPLRSIGLIKDISCMEYCLKEINQKIRSFVLSDDRLILIDFEKIMTEIGYDLSIDERYWFMFKSPLANMFQNNVARELALSAANIEGIFKKVIILDCDNTLWGGIVGEEGLQGIKLCKNDYPGNIYYCFQEQLITLQQSGVLLALCSKNNESDVLEVIDKHPECPLKRENLAAWKINWKDKVSNIICLADELNLSLESFVFIDDDRLECDMVSNNLPMVEVIQVPNKTHELLRIFRKYNFFNRFYKTEEEESLTKRYLQQRERLSESTRYERLEDYIAALELSVEIGEANNNELARAAQLTQKTNQFNLTTKRFSVGEIEELHKSNDHIVLVLKVKDRFGEYGLTGLCILRMQEKKAEILELLLSCRILGRGLEDAFLNEILKVCSERAEGCLVKAEFIKTPKNEQVSKFYDDRGFLCVYSDDSKKVYKLDINNFYFKKINSIEIHRR